MPETSLFLLAVKRLMENGKLHGNSYSQYHFTSSAESQTVDIEDLPGYIDVVIDDLNSQAPIVGSYRSEMIEMLKFNRQMVSDMGILLDVYKDMTFDSIYDNKRGQFNIFSFLMNPSAKFDRVKCDTISVSFNFVLGDVIVILTKVKKSWVSSSKTVEIRRIPPALNINDILVSMQIAVSMIFSPTVAKFVPSEMYGAIEEEARKLPNNQPNDDHRRTIINPITKMKEVVKDPEILKLLPTKWECFASNDISKGLRRIRAPSYLFEN